MILVILSNSGTQAMGITETGSLLCFKYPFEDESDVFDYTILHSKAITTCCYSFDDQYFLTADSEGSVWIYKLQEKDISIKEKQWTYSEEVYFK
jgi:WD40 repeat protein